MAHCRPGGGLPEWATKTAVKALAPIEPFKLFHKINDQVIRNQDQLRKLVQEAEEKRSSMPPGRTSRRGGFAQIGYACFWPNGGGKEEQADAANSKSSIDHASEGHDDETKNSETDSAIGEMETQQ